MRFCNDLVLKNRRDPFTFLELFQKTTICPLCSKKYLELLFETSLSFLDTPY